MTITLPRGLEVEPYNLPDNFEKLVQDKFAEYTEYTADAYTFQDKLCFIDVCVRSCHGNIDADDAVIEYLENRMESDLEDGEFPQEIDYYDLDTMNEIYERGRESQRLYSRDYWDRHDKEVIEKMLIRIIKAVIDWEVVE